MNDSKRDNRSIPLPEGLSAPAQRALASAGIKTLGDLTRFNEKELLALHGFGPKGIEVLRPALQSVGLSLAESST